VITSVIVSTVFTSGVLITKEMPVAAALLLALTLPGVLAFRSWALRVYLAPTKHQPLMRCEAAPQLTEVDAQLFLPPALRDGAVGWWPEEGRVWAKYGLPKAI
jgi:hypothetical protein